MRIFEWKAATLEYIVCVRELLADSPEEAAVELLGWSVVPDNGNDRVREKRSVKLAPFSPYYRADIPDLRIGCSVRRGDRDCKSGLTTTRRRSDGAQRETSDCRRDETP
jgi:hypothetical protein